MKYRYYRLTHPEWEAFNRTGGPKAPDVPLYVNVGFYHDGSLYNPDGYPEEAARAYIEPRYLEWKQERDERRKAGAAKAAKKRRHRREQRIHTAGAVLLREEPLGPRDDCYICHKKLDDEESVARGIGPECWQHVLEWIERSTKPAAQRLRERAAA